VAFSGSEGKKPIDPENAIPGLFAFCPDEKPTCLVSLPASSQQDIRHPGGSIGCSIHENHRMKVVPEPLRVVRSSL
jgi:hypothetical protein